MMNEKEIGEVFKRRNNVRKLMQDPLFTNKEKDESMQLLDDIENLLKTFKAKKKENEFKELRLLFFSNSMIKIQYHL